MFILDTDASNQGIGAALLQEHDDGFEHVVAYASQALSKTERKYSITCKELVSFLHYFQPYLLGRQFELRTDGSSLLWLRRFKKPEGQLAHWLEQLEEYDFKIVHWQGKLHNNADALSRLPYVNCESDISDVSVVANTSLLSVYSPQDILTRQLKDNLVGPFLRAKETGDQPPSIQKGPKWHKMVQLWNQLFVKMGLYIVG